MNTNHAPTIGILADDLTSAADGAGPFVERGLAAALGRRKLPGQGAAVAAIDSGSRSAMPAQAREAVARWSAALSHRAILYKTVDSTLRGHVALEMEACFAASGRTSLVFAPAFPGAGRTTVNGIQLVDGVPVAASVYGRDPMHPARHSALADLVPPGIRDVTLLDARTQDELDAQVAAIPEPESCLWVGSPGLALALARRFGPAAAAPTAFDGVDTELLVVVGSANPCSHRQADQLHAARGITLLRGPAAREGDPAAVLRRVAEEAARTFRQRRCGALIATGGDTMEAVLELLDIHEFDILRELEPGFPLGRARLGDGRSFLLAMKAGGFGAEDALARAVARIRGATQFNAKEIR